MQHQVIMRDETATDAITAAIATLEAMSGGLDARFLPVSETLVQLVETIETVVRGLAEIQSAFASGEGGQAIEAMLRAADQLLAVPEIQTSRHGCFEDSRSTVAALTSCSSDLERVIAMLQFYIMNIKIVAAGSSDFVDFAEEMRTQLDRGQREVKGFGKATVQLLDDINGLLEADGTVSKECFKIIPDVPDSLRKSAGSLNEQQARLSQVALTTGEIAGRIQQRIVAALSAIQISDIARQRIEHVSLACTIARDLGEANGLDRDALATNMVRSQILKLAVAHLESIRNEFRQEASQLLKSLEHLGPDTRRLLEFSRNDSTISDSGLFISRIEEAIGQTRSLTDQLNSADREASAIMRSVMTTVNMIGEQVDQVRRVGLNVGNMSVNAHLRCRRHEAISKPVAVIAREIKLQADLIKERSLDIGEHSDRLKSLANALSRLSGAGLDTVAGALDSSLSALRSAASKTSAGIALVDVNATALSEKLEITSGDLRESLNIMASIDAVIADLNLHCLALEPISELPSDHPLFPVMARIRSSYTMASERELHDRLVPGGAPPVVSRDSAEPDLATDDELFDDGLF